MGVDPLETDALSFPVMPDFYGMAVKDRNDLASKLSGIRGVGREKRVRGSEKMRYRAISSVPFLRHKS